MLEINQIHQGDCLELMKDIPNKSVDMILCDLPYGVTQNKKDIVLDNCIGTGWTAVACLNTNRNFIGIELDKEYVKVAQQRIKEVAGCKAEGDDGIPPTMN